MLQSDDVMVPNMKVSKFEKFTDHEVLFGL